MINDYGITLEECDRLNINGYSITIKNTGQDYYVIYGYYE